MAEDESNNEVKEGGAPPEPAPTNVTRTQYLALVLLSALLVYLYVIWPQWASKEDHLKEPGLYLDEGLASFEAAHRSQAFPMEKRINALQNAEWAYGQARKAEGKLSVGDLFRWGTSSFEIAKQLYPGSVMAMVRPLELFEEARGMMDKDIAALKAKLGPLQAQIEIDQFEIHPNKLYHALALGYLEVGNVDKAIPLLERLRDQRHRYDQFRRFRDRPGGTGRFQPPLPLGASPYLLQLNELQEVEFLLGRAQHLDGRAGDAIESLENFLESSRSVMDGEGDHEIRYQALVLLTNMLLDEIHRLENEMKTRRGQLDFGPKYSAAQVRKEELLAVADRRFEELFLPRYQVFGLTNQALMWMEVSYKLGKVDQTLRLAREFQSSDPHQRNEMRLWRSMAMLQKNPKLDLTAALNAIAGDNTRDRLRLAALVILGDQQAKMGEVDLSLGKLLKKNFSAPYHPGAGSYARASTQFTEDDFDNNTMIDKFTLIDMVKKRAHQAEMEGEEEEAIRLYRFLLAKFTVPQASLIQGIARNQRRLGQEAWAKDVPKAEMSEEARRWFQLSAESYLTSIDGEKVAFEKEAHRQAHFQAAESYFEGGFYTKAYENYGIFIDKRSNDDRVSQARHKRGLSALYRKPARHPDHPFVVPPEPRNNRFVHARIEFFQNIAKGRRPMKANDKLPKSTLTNAFSSNLATSDNVQELDLERKMLWDQEEDLLDSVLGDTNLGSRDIWAYNSLLELGKTYYAEHRYDLADKVFDRIRSDPRFSPRYEVWRKAAYAQGYLAYDRVIESKTSPPWDEAILLLEDLLQLYNLDTFPMRFSEQDVELRNTFRRENAKVKFLLASALLQKGEVKEAIRHARELLQKRDHFDLALAVGETETTSFCKEQTARALLGDALYADGQYLEAMEEYRKAHDRHLDSMERPLYSLNIVDCLIGLGRKEEAINHLKRTRYEFEEFYEPDTVALADNPAFSKASWQSLIDMRQQELEGL